MAVSNIVPHKLAVALSSEDAFDVSRASSEQEGQRTDVLMEEVVAQDQAAEITADIPSTGSRLHASGSCKPCAFFRNKGCLQGEKCLFCHLCPAFEKKRRERVRKQLSHSILSSMSRREQRFKVAGHSRQSSGASVCTASTWSGGSSTGAGGGHSRQPSDSSVGMFVRSPSRLFSPTSVAGFGITTEGATLHIGEAAQDYPRGRVCSQYSHRRVVSSPAAAPDMTVKHATRAPTTDGAWQQQVSSVAASVVTMPAPASRVPVTDEMGASVPADDGALGGLVVRNTFLEFRQRATSPRARSAPAALSRAAGPGDLPCTASTTTCLTARGVSRPFGEKCREAGEPEGNSGDGVPNPYVLMPAPVPMVMPAPMLMQQSPVYSYQQPCVALPFMAMPMVAPMYGHGPQWTMEHPAMVPGA